MCQQVKTDFREQMCAPGFGREPLVVNLKVTDSIPRGGNKICSDGCDNQVLF